MLSFWLLSVFSIGVHIVSGRPKPCIPARVCTTEQKDARNGLVLNSEQYVCKMGGIDDAIYKYKYDVGDCEGFPSDIVEIEEDDPIYSLIKCTECDGYIYYKSYRIPTTESNCNSKDKYGYKEYLVTYNCEEMSGNSQKLSCSNNSFTMKYYDTNSKCHGTPMVHVTVKNGCSDVDFEFFQKHQAYKSYQELYHCGYIIKTDKKKDEL